MQISITSKAAGESWKKEVQRLNNETKKLLDDVAKAVSDVQNNAESSIVDELVTFANQTTSASVKILEGMNKLCETITGILNAVDKAIEAGKELIKSAVRTVVKR